MTPHALVPEPLGESLPPRDAHAISVSMPEWRHVVGYEENDPAVVGAMACGYPRFFRHPLVRALEALAVARLLQEDAAAEAEDWQVMAAPDAAAAARLRSFLVDSNRESVREEQVQALEVGGLAHLVRFPSALAPTAKQFWQHSGEIVSSRQAQRLADALQAQADGRPADASALQVRGHEAHRLLRARVAGRYFEDEDHVRMAVQQGVGLYPTGMGAIFAAVRLLNKFRGGEAKSVLVGFPYVDTLKILQRPEWCPKGVYFFPTCGETEMKQIEEIVAREEILGIFTEYPSNPLLSMADLRRLAKCAHDNGTVLVVDDTVGSYNVNTMKFKTADIVATSLSKIFCGAGNVMGGSLVLNPEGHMYEQLVAKLDAQNDSFMFQDDAKALLEASADLSDRVARTNANASTIATRLKAHPMVTKIYYTQFGNIAELYHPFLTESKEEQGLPRYGPLLSILINGGFPAAKAFYDALNVAKGPSLGTNFTLSCPYTLLAHYGELDFVESCGVDRNLIRISIGLEDVELLWRDFEKAFAAAEIAASA